MLYILKYTEQWLKPKNLNLILTLYGNFNSHSHFSLKLFLIVDTRILLKFWNTVTFLSVISKCSVLIPVGKLTQVNSY